MKKTTNKMMTVTFLNRKELALNIIPLFEEAIEKLEKDSLAGGISDECIHDLITILDLFKSSQFTLSNHEINFINSNPNKIIEYIVFRYKFLFYPNLHKLNTFPLHILVEPSSICNLKCVMCFQSDETFRKTPYSGTMSLDLFKKIVDESVENNCKSLTISGRGEPLLNPHIGEMMKYCSGKFFDYKINTNAMLLNKKIAQNVLDSGITELVISIDSSDPEQYSKIRVGGDFYRVLKNIELLRELREKNCKGSNINIRVSAVQIFEEQDMERFSIFWKEYADDVSYTKAIDRWDTYHNPSNNSKISCQRLWHRFYIWWDGIASPCDYDYKSFLDVGNVINSKIKDIWLGLKMKKLRDAHTAGARSDIFPCKGCSL
jgi:MoaA/NifB/PqqE/SkfB family radical SAM enzyme